MSFLHSDGEGESESVEVVSDNQSGQDYDVGILWCVFNALDVDAIEDYQKQIYL
jgi:hypothetical protein